MANVPDPKAAICRHCKANRKASDRFISTATIQDYEVTDMTALFLKPVRHASYDFIVLFSLLV